MNELRSWLSIITVLLVAIVILLASLCGKLCAETILDSTATLKETEDYVWVKQYCYENKELGPGTTFYAADKPFPSQFYQTYPREQIKTKDGSEITVWKKFEKVYYPIEWTEGRDCSDCNGRFDAPVRTLMWCPDSVKCEKEIVYFKDGRVAWREVEPGR